MTRTTHIAVAAVLAVLAALPLTLAPAVAARDLQGPVGAIAGVGARPGLTMTIEATTDPDRLGRASIEVDGRTVEVRLDCVRTYSLVGVILSVPIVNEVGYSSGIGTDGRRWYLYANEGFAFDASTTPGPPVSHETCGVGYVVGSGVPAIKVVGARTTVWTPVG